MQTLIHRWSRVLCRAGWPRSSHQPEPAYTYILKWERHKLLVYLLNCIFRPLSYSSWLCILTYNTPKYKLRVIVFLSLKLLVHKTDVKTQYFKKWSAKQNQHLLFFSPQRSSQQFVHLVCIPQGILCSQSKSCILRIIIHIYCTVEKNEQRTLYTSKITMHM